MRKSHSFDNDVDEIQVFEQPIEKQMRKINSKQLKSSRKLKMILNNLNNKKPSDQIDSESSNNSNSVEKVDSNQNSLEVAEINKVNVNGIFKGIVKPGNKGLIEKAKALQNQNNNMD